jgi:hypothetical protein
MAIVESVVVAYRATRIHVVSAALEPTDAADEDRIDVKGHRCGTSGDG